MVKISNILGNLFHRNGSSKLETDASPMAPRSKAEARVPAASTGSGSSTTVVGNGNSLNGNVDERAVVLQDNVALVPAAPLPVESIQPRNSIPASTVVNNFQHNTLTAPQTSISNTTGMQVYQIKNANNLHIGNSYTFNSRVTEESPSTSGLSQTAGVKWANLKLSNTISQMMQSQEEVDSEILDTISRHLGYEWKSFARKLDYSEGQIDAFESDHPTLSEQIYHFVLDWTRNDDDPTLGRLVTLLWNNKHKETVYYVKQVWKKQRDSNTPGRSS